MKHPLTPENLAAAVNMIQPPEMPLILWVAKNQRAWASMLAAPIKRIEVRTTKRLRQKDWLLCPDITPDFDEVADAAAAFIAIINPNAARLDLITDGATRAFKDLRDAHNAHIDRRRASKIKEEL